MKFLAITIPKIDGNSLDQGCKNAVAHSRRTTQNLECANGICTVLPLCYEENPRIYLEKKQKIITNPRHPKCLEKVKIKLETHAAGTFT